MTTQPVDTPVHVRPMTPDDVPAVAACRVRGWQQAYAGMVPQPHLDAMDLAKEAERRRTHLATAAPGVVNLVAERGGEVLAWGCFGLYRETEGAPPHSAPGRPVAELYALYALPEHHSTGAGRALMTACLDRAGAAGFAALSLWVLKENAVARRFYEKAGLRFDGAEEPFEIGGATVLEVRYARALAG
ncbi:GNAT family N-acetyltransferase [Streptomyces sp. NBC_00237]|uniref:GNAT family N-acetyltransferase n=1 Tax=Streptomyces sp. NBC_00237 TaxID=2975687 RepID=UPI002253A4E4|nr:GNAT family N-acetyltransferase [Streptomyces sp. NBC_00237]MCX5203084.1 GNAT family N-acetyltransferase [Streptomyces sp. NBC_00237]